MLLAGCTASSSMICSRKMFLAGMEARIVPSLTETLQWHFRQEVQVCHTAFCRAQWHLYCTTANRQCKQIWVPVSNTCQHRSMHGLMSCKNVGTKCAKRSFAFTVSIITAALACIKWLTKRSSKSRIDWRDNLQLHRTTCLILHVPVHKVLLDFPRQPPRGG